MRLVAFLARLKSQSKQGRRIGVRSRLHNKDSFSQFLSSPMVIVAPPEPKTTTDAVFYIAMIEAEYI